MSSSSPVVSVLIATFRRRPLLQRALDSVHKQDFRDYELVVCDDCSPDDTPILMREMAALDPRIRYIRLPKNVGGTFGDREILRRFVHEWARGTYFIYLCDDDFWIPDDLLSRAVAVMEDNPSVVQVMGAQVQIYPNGVREVPKIESFWHYEDVPGVRDALGMTGIFPDGLIERDRFLDLQCEDPVTRNVLTGASLFRKSAFLAAGVLARKKGSRWQAGYELTTGIATQGDSYYVDRPSVAAGVDINSASFRGTQWSHLQDCMTSVSIAFDVPKRKADDEDRRKLAYFETRMKHAILMNYALNKVSFQLGWFGSKVLPEIRKVFAPEIPAKDFLRLAAEHRLPLSEDNRTLIAISSESTRAIKLFAEKQEHERGKYDWHRSICAWPADHTRGHSQ